MIPGPKFVHNKLNNKILLCWTENKYIYYCFSHGMPAVRLLDTAYCAVKVTLVAGYSVLSS
jgi:hypothetical protein